METLTDRDTTTCNPGAVVFTMLLGLFFGVLSSVVLAIAAHAFQTIANPGVASPGLAFELIATTFGGLLFSLAAVVGATVALSITDHRLRYPRSVQAGIAGIGAALAGLGMVAVIGRTATLDPAGVAGLVAFIAVSVFALMCARARAHTSPAPRSRRLRTRGITL